MPQPWLRLLVVALPIGCSPAVDGMALLRQAAQQPIQSREPTDPPRPTTPLTKKEQAAKDASDKAEAEREKRDEDAVWAAYYAKASRVDGARAQCEYEVAGNPMTLQGGWLDQAVTQNRLFDLCMRAKGAY